MVHNKWQQMKSSGKTNENECERKSAGKGEWFLFKNEIIRIYPWGPSKEP